MPDSSPRCPDMELAPARDFDPDILLPGEGEAADIVATKEFVLLLALAFNDIKALCWVDDQLRKGAPEKKASEPPRADPYPGNWVGTLKTFDRLSSGVVNETYRLVRSYARKGVFKTPLFERAHRNLARRYRDTWKAFLRDAEHPDAERLRSYHKNIRNAVGYHYYTGGKAMTTGYRAHVAFMPGNPMSDRAWASFGKNMEESRFYFADAAAVQVQELIGIEAGRVTPEERRKNVGNINAAIRMLLEQLLRELKALHEGKAPPAPASAE